MALLDLTEYTVGGADAGKLTVTASRLTATSIDINDEVYAYKDLGAGNLTDFTYRFKLNLDEEAGNMFMLLWGVSVGANFTNNDKETALDGFAILAQNGGAPIYYLGLYSYPTGNNDVHIYDGFADFTRWLEVSRNGSTATLKIYTDEYSTLEYELSTDVGSTAFRYHTAFASVEYPIPAGDVGSCYIENLNLVSQSSNSLITTVNGIDYSSISKIGGIAIADISKIGGIADE